MNTASARLSSLSILLKHLTENEVRVYVGSQQKYDELKNFINKQHALISEMKEIDEDFQQLSDKEKSILGDTVWEDIRTKVIAYLHTHRGVDEITNKEHLRLMIRLSILRTYIIDHSPRRLEILSLKWTNIKDNENYYKEGIITLNDYKTVSRHGQYRIGVSEETQQLMEVIRKYREKEGVDYIFGSEQQVKSDSYRTGTLNEAFEASCNLDRISVNILRKLYIDWKRRKNELEWTTARKECARQLGHDLRMQQHRYKKRERVVESEIGREEKKRASPRYATSEEKKALEESIKLWEERNGNERYKWKEIWQMREELRKVDGETVKRWGIKFVKGRKD